MTVSVDTDRVRINKKFRVESVVSNVLENGSEKTRGHYPIHTKV